MIHLPKPATILASMAVIVIALAFGVSVGLAKSGPSQQTVSIHSHDHSACGGASKKVIGSADVVVAKGVLTIKGQIHGADPGTYRIFLYAFRSFQSPCPLAPSADLGKFKVDGGGDGNFAGSTAISDQTLFRLVLYHGGCAGCQYNSSPIFKISVD